MVEISAGELIDKITILEIKHGRIRDESKLQNVRMELQSLEASRDAALCQSPDLDRLTTELKAVNESLWEIEDAIRDCEHRRDFGDRFVELARSVYRNNDRRAGLERSINESLGSKLVEEKSYSQY